MINLSFNPEISWRAAAIPKKDGRLRYLLIPGDELKQAQRDILDELYRNKDLKIHPCATGFVPFRNTITGVLKHDRDTPLIIQIDIHNFFPTFPVRTVIKVLRESGIENSKLDYIERYAVFHGKKGDQLPQGSPTSPYLTNIGMYETDCKISGIASKFGYKYTRYADDLAFSVADKEKAKEAVENRSQLMAAVASCLDNELSLQISWKKTLCAFHNSPRVPRRIVGVTIRKDGLGYNAPKHLRKEARAAVHNLYKELLAGKRKEDLWPVYWKVIGMVGYCDYVRSQSDFIVAGKDPCINRNEMKYIRKAFNYANRSYSE